MTSHIRATQSRDIKVDDVAHASDTCVTLPGFLVNRIISTTDI